MIQPTCSRRTFLNFGVASGVCALSGFGSASAMAREPMAIKPFAHSRTVSSFAAAFACFQDDMPRRLLRAFDAEFARGDVAPDAPEIDRKRAEFFAWLALRHIAPHALRRAGYDGLAANCGKQSDLSEGAAAAACSQHTIGMQYAYSETPRLAGLAYGASAHAATAAFYAGCEDIETVVMAGEFCARALIGGFFYDDDIDIADAVWVWEFAAGAMNAAIELQVGGTEPG